MDESVRSFFRHVSGVPSESMQDEKDRKRKRDMAGLPPPGSGLPVLENSGHENQESPQKKVRNKEAHQEKGDAINNSLPKSIESLYESILSAQKELEAGRSLNADSLSV